MLILPIFIAWSSWDTFARADSYLRIIASLGGALIGAAMPGRLKLKIPGGESTGAVAIFILIYTVNPSSKVVQKPDPPTPSRPSDQDKVMVWMQGWLFSGPGSSLNTNHVKVLRKWFDQNKLSAEDTETFIVDPRFKLQRDQFAAQLDVDAPPNRLPPPDEKVINRSPSIKRHVASTIAASEPTASTVELPRTRSDFQLQFSHGYSQGTWHIIVRSVNSEGEATAVASSLNERYPNLFFEEGQGNPNIWMVTLGSGMGLSEANHALRIAQSLPGFKDAYRYCWGYGADKNAFSECKK